MPAAPQIAPMSTPPNAFGAPSQGSNFFTALSQLPMMVQQAKFNNSSQEEKQFELDDKQLERIAMAAQANPQFGSSPQVLQHVAQIYGRRKLPPPIKTEGAMHMLDVDAIIPKKELTPDDITKVNATFTDKPARNAYYKAHFRNVSPEILDADIIAPISAGEKAGLDALPMKMIEMVKSGLPISSVKALLAQSAPRLKLMGISDPSAILDDPAIAQALDDRANIEMQKLVMLGILKPGADIEYKHQRAAYDLARLRQGDRKLDQGDRGLDQRDDVIHIKEQQLKQQKEHWETTDAMKLRSLDQMDQRIGISMKNAERMDGVSAQKFLHTQAADIRKDFAQAQSAYNALKGIETRRAASFLPPDADNVGQLEKLSAKIELIRPQLDQMNNVGTALYNKQVNNTAGREVRPVSTPQAPAAAAPTAPTAPAAPAPGSKGRVSRAKLKSAGLSEDGARAQGYEVY